MAVVVMVGDCSQFHYTSPSFLAETYMILPPPKKIVPSIIHPSLVFIRKLVYLCYCWPRRCCCFIPHSTYHIFDSVCFSSIFVYALYICTMRYVERIILSYIFDFRYGFFFLSNHFLNGLIRIFLMCAPAKEVSSGMRVCVSICFDNNASHKKMNQFLFSVAVCMLAVSNCR